MMTMGNQSKVKKIFLLVPALFAALLMGFMFLSCDVGDEADPPTGPETVYDPDFDEARPGINVKVSPSSVTVPDPVTGEENDDIVVQAWFRDPAGMPVQGLQMNFTADPASPNFTFQPPATFTDGNGQASVNMVVAKATPKGSYTVLAYTSPASAGPNAKGYGRFYVNVGETVSTPDTPTGNTAPADTLILVVGVDTGFISYSTAGASSTLGNPVQYTFNCGNGTFDGPLPVGVLSGQCRFQSAGSFLVSARATSSTGVQSDWSAGLAVTVTDIFP